MKARYCTAIIFSALVMLLGSICSYSKDTRHPLKSAPKDKRVIQTAKTAPKLTSARIHIVRQGDNLFRIALTHKTTAAALKTTNKLQGNIIRVGQKLRIPGSKNMATQVASAKVAETPPAPKESYISPTISALTDQDQIADSGEQPLRLRLVKAGFEMLGVRYRRSGGSEESGFDCSGLVKSLFSRFNIELPRSSREQYQHGEKVDRNNLEIGDLVFFSSGGKRPNHVGIYVGDNKFLHAALKARRVIVSDLNKIWYTMRYLGARRVMDLWGDEPSSDPQSD
jgi:peptidoglycan DL-endopeptidase LytE